MFDIIGIDTRHVPLAGPSAAVSVALPSVNLSTIQHRLAQIIANAAALPETSAELLKCVIELTSARSCSYMTVSRGGPETIASDGNFAAGELVRGRQNAVAELASEVSRTQESRSLLTKHDAMISVPVFVSPRRTDVLNAIVANGRGNFDFLTISLQLIAAYASMWWQLQDRKQVEWEADMAASVVEIVADIERCQSFQSGCEVLANSLQGVLNVESIAVGMRTTGNSWLRVVAVSKQTTANRWKSPAQGLEKAMNAQAQANAGANSGSQPADGTMTFPLITEEAQELGALTIQLRRDEESAKVATYMRAVSPYIAGALLTSKRIHEGHSAGLNRWWTKAFQWLGSENTCHS